MHRAKKFAMQNILKTKFSAISDFYPCTFDARPSILTSNLLNRFVDYAGASMHRFFVVVPYGIT